MTKKKDQKKKKRQERLRKEHHSRRENETSNIIDIESTVDDALMLLEEGQGIQAERILEKLKKKHGGHPHVLYGSGVLELIKKDMDKAIHFFKAATQISPNFVEAFFNLGNAYQTQFQVPEMVAAFNRVLEIGTPGSQIVRHSKDMLDNLKKHIMETDGISLDDYIRGWQTFHLGFESMQAGLWEEAIAKFKETVKINPKNVQSHGNLGICYSHVGRQADAISSFDRAIELDPNYEPALVNRTIVASLKEGQCLNAAFKSIEFYKNYAIKKRSYIAEYAEIMENSRSETSNQAQKG